MMTTIAATEGPKAARDLAQSMLNDGAIITTTALREPVAKTLADHANSIEGKTGNPLTMSQLEMEMINAKAKKKKK